jgi:hypothetical protein
MLNQIEPGGAYSNRMPHGLRLGPEETGESEMTLPTRER